MSEIQWRQTSKVHAVKLDCGSDGWESYCGQRETDSWRLKRPRPISFEYGICKTCLARTNYKVLLVPSDEPPKPKRVFHKYLTVQLRCGCLYTEQTKLRVIKLSKEQAILEEMKQNGRRCVHHHRIEKAVMLMGYGNTEQPLTSPPPQP